MKKSSPSLKTSLEWKPLKWWIISLFALGLAIWVNSSALHVLAGSID